MPDLLSYDELASRFERTFGRAPEVFARAPGRVNIIGEHTDYNDGFVLPAAIERETRMVAAERQDAEVHLVALDLNRSSDFSLAGLRPSDTERWSNYVRGVIAGLAEAGYPVRGMDVLMHGDVPIGSGLSSSAAVQMATVQVCSGIGGFDVPPREAALIGQRSEHTFVGANVGIMDQLASALGQPDHALLIDCRELLYEPVPVPPGAAILIADTSVRRHLAGSAYNERRAQCEAAARALEVPALRDATLHMLDGVEMPAVVEKRARHVIGENARVHETVVALRAGDLAQVGRLMDASHASLRDLYEVSSVELDTMVELLCAQPGCYGARLTGAGFGGCAVALMVAGADQAAIPAVHAAYKAATGLEPALYPSRPAAGASYRRA